MKFIILICYSNSYLFGYDRLEDYLIERTNKQFNLINDYQVDMTVKVEVPAFRMPKKKYKVYYKQPNKVKVKAKGFGM